MRLERELRTARTVAIDAARLVMEIRAAGISVDRKAGDEPVTEADRAADGFIVERLQRAFPDDAIVSEEAPEGAAERLLASRVWLVDPIDGTSDFILGDTGFAVMIGLAVDGVPQVGVLVQPRTGRIWDGIAGVGAWLEQPGMPRAPISTTGLAAPPGIRLVASKTHRTPRVNAVRTALEIEDEINVGGVGLKIALVAEGSRDLYVYTGGRTKIWDCCAPEAVLAGAGGRLTDLDGRPLGYRGPDLYNRRGIVASNGPLHSQVIDRLAPIVAETDR